MLQNDGQFVIAVGPCRGDAIPFICLRAVYRTGMVDFRLYGIGHIQFVVHTLGNGVVI